MAAIYDYVRRPSQPVHMPAFSPEVTIASCLDAYLPIYNFSTSDSWATEKARKLTRVDSMPVVPDFFAEPTCDSPPSTLLGGTSSLNLLTSYFLPDDNASSFNNLPVDIHSHAITPLTGVNDGDYDGCGAVPTAASNLMSVHCGRAQPRRNPSDVLLSRPGRVFVADSDSGSDDAAPLEVPSRGVLEAALLTLWEDRAERGLFRYDVTQCPTRVLPGWLGFVAQLNEGRATKKRPTELTVDRVMQPFDPAKFNFKKAAISEALVAFCPDGGDGGRPELASAAAPLAAAAADASPNLVIINVSPIDYGHVLLVPRVLDELPQALGGETVLLALQFARELSNPHFRVGYNSLGAYATINHLHFQSYYLAATLPCEVVPTTPLPGALATPPVRAGGAAAMAATPSRKRAYGDLDAAAPIRVSRLRGYPVNTFVVEAVGEGRGATAAATEAVAAVVATAAERLQAANQPFNLLISDAGRRVFIFPQCFAERQAAGVIPGELLDTGVNPAAFEIAGHMLLKRPQDFEGASEELACRLLAQASLPEERFMAVARMCFGGGGQGCGGAVSEMSE